MKLNDFMAALLPKKSRERKENTSRTALHWKYFYPLIILMAGCAVYANTLKVPFIFDDLPYIVENPAIKDFHYYSDAQFVEKALDQAKFDNNFRTRKLTFFTFALNYHFHGLNLTGYHAVNILIHLANGLLIYFLAMQIFQTPLGASRLEVMVPGVPAPQTLALLVALFFVIHPLQTQAVTYICQRFASLATLLSLLSLMLYVRSRLLFEIIKQGGAEHTRRIISSKAWIQYGISLASLILAMYAKETSFTMPLLIILFEITFFGRPSRSRCWMLLPYAATMAIIPLITFSEGAYFYDIAQLSSSISIGNNENLSLHYLFTQFRVILVYLRLLVFPAGQNFEHDIPMQQSFLQPPVYLSFLLLSLVAGLGIFLYYRAIRYPEEAGNWKRMTGFGIIFFFVSLAVESSFLPLADVMIEHRLYLPMTGVAFVILGLGELLRQRAGKKALRVAALLSISVLIALAVTSIHRNHIWRDTFSFWQDAAGKSPNKFRPVLNLGIEYAATGNHEKAVELFHKSLQHASRFKDWTIAYESLENSYKQLNKNDLLQRSYSEFIEILLKYSKTTPDDPNVLSHTGILYAKTGRYPEAEEALRKVIEIKPESASAYVNMGALLQTRNRTAEALEYFNKALAIDPENAMAHEKKGDALIAGGDIDAGLAAYETALGLNPELRDIHAKIAKLYLRQGNTEKAEKVLSEAIALHGDDPRAHSDLGTYYAQLKRWADAEKEYLAALDLKENSYEVLADLAKIYLNQNRVNEALEVLNKAAALAEWNPDIQNMRGYAYFEKGDYQAAASAAKRAVELAPTDSLAKKRLEQMLQLLSGKQNHDSPAPPQARDSGEEPGR